MCTVCLVARFQDHKESHVVVVKRIFRYLESTPKHHFWYLKDIDFSLNAYINGNWEGCVDYKRRISGGAFFSWM